MEVSCEIHVEKKKDVMVKTPRFVADFGDNQMQ